jgi:hypothetical protein
LEIVDCAIRLSIAELAVEEFGEWRMAITPIAASGPSNRQSSFPKSALDDAAITNRMAQSGNRAIVSKSSIVNPQSSMDARQRRQSRCRICR